MKTLQKTSTQHHLPAWQIEYATRLHSICTAIAARQAKGGKLSRGLRVFARRWNGKPYRCDPSRRFRLSAKSLERAYGKWRNGGGVPSAIRLNYKPDATSKVTAPVLRAFVSALFLPSVNSGVEAYRLLQARRRRAGHLPGTGKGRRPSARKLNGVSYSTLLRHLPAGVTRKIPRLRLQVTQAERSFAQLRFEIEAQALATLPAQPKRHRRNPSDFYVI